MKKCWGGSALLLTLLSVLACNFSSPAAPQTDSPGLIHTWAAETLLAARGQATGTFTSAPGLPAEPTTPAVPTRQTTLAVNDTPHPTPTITPVPSLTPLYPTKIIATLAATETGPTAASGTSLACNSAQFIEDVTIPDGFNIPVGLPFTKVWRVKNTGSCTWNESYQVVFLSGDRLKGTTTSLQKPVKPNETIDLAVNMITPLEQGTYKGNWMLQDGSTTFGAGSGAARPFFVQIEAIPNTSQIIYNFAVDFCAARWESSAGDRLCPGIQGDPNGFAIMLHKAEVETRKENEPALWMQPFNEKGGWITGTFPAIEIQAGYQFQAEIGCLASYEKCNVNFELWYRLPESPKKKLGVWQEYNDQHLTRVSIDLSPLAGQKASFILIVYANNNPEQAAAFWLMPQIRLP